jgi:uncharacterized protein DUF998
MPTIASIPVSSLHRDRLLLWSGILSSILYVVFDLTASALWTDYRYSAQAVSELSAIGAPTRPLWLVLAVVYPPLLFAFAWGVWRTTGGRRSLRVVAELLFAMAALNVVWSWFPMHLRGEPTTLTDTMHVIFAGVQVVLTLTAIAIGAAGLGKVFRAYSIASIVVMLAAGTATFLYAPQMATDQPTPGIGLLERINVYGYLLWIAMLATTLRRQRSDHCD